MGPSNLALCLYIFAYSLNYILVLSDTPECIDINAELRSDNPNCVLTCNKRSLLENPEMCFGHPQFTESCYCKEGFYLEEMTKKCVRLQDCPCNATNNEISVFENKCGSYCVTFHTLEVCPKLLRSQCWCKTTHCMAADGTCVIREI